MFGAFDEQVRTRLSELQSMAQSGGLDEAVEEMIEALRDYAEDWAERLHSAPNHADNWGLVQIVGLASDEQLREWLLA